LLSSNISSRCPHNMVNFGILAAEIVSLVWGTPANFKGFCVLAALLHGTLVVGVSQTAAFNRGHHLYTAGRPSSWALAHISSFHIIFRLHCSRPTVYADAAYCTNGVARSVCRSVHWSVTIVSAAKTPETIEVPFGL